MKTFYCIKPEKYSFPGKIRNYFWKLYLKKSKKVYLGKDVMFNTRTIFGGANKISEKCIIANADIGYATYINKNCELANAKIGKYTSIARDVKIIYGTHPINEFVSTCPVFYSQKFGGCLSYADTEYFDPFLRRDDNCWCEIGNDVWIGAGVTIRGGVKIGDGAVIGACALVTKDIPPYSVCVGVPAKIIKYRYSDEEINLLLSLEWWNKQEEWISNHAALFRNKEQFFKLHNLI